MRFWLLLPVALCACDSPGVAKVDFRRQVPAGVAGGAWVAKFSGQTVTEKELAQRFAEMNPYARARFQTVEQRADYVEGVARFELLSQEALRRGLQNDPEVIDAARKVMVQQLLKRELDDATRVSDADVAAYYQAHRSDYVKPAMTRLTLIAVKRDDAARVLESVKALGPLDAAGFGKLAREFSQDEASRALDGDLRFLSDEELAARFGDELVSAASALTRVGDVSGLVESPKGTFIIKLAGRQLALDLSLEQAKAGIAQLLTNESKQERFRALLERLKRDAKYEVNTEALAAMNIDVKAPATPPAGPAPGFIPAPQPTR